MAADNVIHLNEDNFDDRIKKTAGPLLVDFWATWCGPCKVIAPALQQLAIEMAGRVTIAEVNVDENGDLSNRFGVRSIPTLVVFKGGRIMEQHVGALSKAHIRRLLERHL